LASGRLFWRSLMMFAPCAFIWRGLRIAFNMLVCHSSVEPDTITFWT
jgi:hypothetical protein